LTMLGRAGSPASFTWPAGESTDSQSTHRALLVRGRVFQGTEVLHWQTVASELWKVPLDLPQLRNYFSRCSGSFWAAYVCVAQGDLCVFAVSDTVGVVPMWLALGEGFILLSPYWPSEQVPLSNLSCNLHLAIGWRQASPRLMHQWSASGGLEASMPDHFFGLHGRKLELEMAEAKRGEEEMTLQLREALIQAVRRCVAGEEHVGLLFSGGLDSGLLAWLFTEELAPCRCSCYTVGFHMEDKKIKN
ncbi:unnamed protein product, partial [Cladocopium goreaui]